MKITLYIDVVSPFAYVAYHVFRVSLLPKSASWSSVLAAGM